MKKLFLTFTFTLATLLLAISIVSAQDSVSAGCNTYSNGGGTASDNFNATFAQDEVIIITVTSADGALFDVTIGGTLKLNDAADGASTSYKVPADGNVVIDIAIVNLATGTYTIDCRPADDDGDEYGGTLCHYPPGNPAAAHTITVGLPAVETHIAQHGDTRGPCPEGVQTRSDNFSVNITIFVIFATDTIQVYGDCTDTCEEIMNTPIILLIDLDLVIINIGSSDDDQGEDSDDDEHTGEFMEVENPENYGFVLDEISQDGLYVVIYYLHPDPEDATIGVFQINVYDNGSLKDDSILVFISTTGDIIRWTDHNYWAQQAEEAENAS